MFNYDVVDCYRTYKEYHKCLATDVNPCNPLHLEPYLAVHACEELKDMIGKPPAKVTIETVKGYLSDIVKPFTSENEPVRSELVQEIEHFLKAFLYECMMKLERNLQVTRSHKLSFWNLRQNIGYFSFQTIVTKMPGCTNEHLSEDGRKLKDEILEKRSFRVFYSILTRAPFGKRD